MRINGFLSASALLAALQTANGAPTATSTNPPLRGSEDLLGYSESNTLNDENTDNIPYQPVPGQNDDAKIGAYLDFESSDNPQPIRGSLGATDPGPRECW